MTNMNTSPEKIASDLERLINFAKYVTKDIDKACEPVGYCDLRLIVRLLSLISLPKE